MSAASAIAGHARIKIANRNFLNMNAAVSSMCNPTMMLRIAPVCQRQVLNLTRDADRASPSPGGGGATRPGDAKHRPVEPRGGGAPPPPPTVPPWEAATPPPPPISRAPDAPP